MVHLIHRSFSESTLRPKAPAINKTISIDYRADIDGLRALAVLAVIFYHFDIMGFSGGYIGVDVFFVISGYLIGSLILFQLEQNEFKFSTFYLRRIRRLIPAFIVVILFSIITAYLYILPMDFKQYGQSLFAATVYSSNILFFLEAGYFDTASHLKPLLHTWSLSVEEQFYIIFPALAWLLIRFKRKLVIVFFISISLISFFASVFYISRDSAAVFFLYPFRAWEMFLGVILALRILPKITNSIVANIFGFLGFCLILIPCTIYNSSTTFPGMTALSPCFGAAIFIYSGMTYRTLTKSWFSKTLPVFIGKISYSLYLWHWPLFVFYKYIKLNTSYEKLSGLEIIFLLLFTFFAAILSWKFVEQPFRYSKLQFMKSKAVIFPITAIFSIGFFLFGFYIHTSNGIPDRYDPKEQQYIFAANDLFGNQDNCSDENNVFFPGLPICTIGNPQVSNSYILIWGDSHALAFNDGIKQIFNKYGADAVITWSGGCPPVFNIEKDESVSSKDTDYECTKQHHVLKDILEKEHKRIKSIVLIGRWSYYLNGRGYGLDESISIKVWEEGTNKETVKSQQNLFIDLFEESINLLSVYNISIYVVEQPPEFSYFNARKLAMAYINDKKDYFKIADEIAYEPYDNVEDRQGPFQMLINKLELEGRVQILRTHQYFCNNQTCSTMIDSMPSYVDNNHISTNGAKLISELFLPVLNDSELVANKNN